MLDIDQVRVQTFATDRLYVTWSIKPTVEDVLDYHFIIERSESPEGEWIQLADNVVDRYLLVDHVPLTHGWRRFYYRIKVVHNQSGEMQTSDPASLEAPPDLIALEIRRRELLYFREYAGKRMILFPRRTFGTRCSCWDETLQKRLVSRCPTCYDTGFVGGYHKPIWLWMQLSPSPSQLSVLNEVKLNDQQTVAITTSLPEIHPQDVIVEPDSTNRWRVVQAKRTERFRTIVHQELLLTKILPGDIEYTLPVVLDDIFDIYFSPRNLVMTTVGAV